MLFSSLQSRFLRRFMALGAIIAVIQWGAVIPMWEGLSSTDAPEEYLPCGTLATSPSLIGSEEGQSSDHGLHGASSDVAYSVPPLQAGEQASLWKALATARLAIQPLSAAEAAMPRNLGVRFFAQNPGEQITTRFLDGKIRIESGGHGSWSAYLGVAGGNQTSPELAGDRVEYRHANGITEWYENRPEGVEHAFEITDRLSPEAGNLRLTLCLQGTEITADSSQNDGALQFSDPATGMAILSYGVVKAWDSTGRELAAHYVTRRSEFDIVVADASAVYPVTIDPLITSLEAKMLPEVNGDGAPGDNLGSSVAISGGTALVGAPRDASAAGGGTGSVYVFTRSGDAWIRQAKLTDSDPREWEVFGGAVALEGDTALIGVSQNKDEEGFMTGSAFVFTRVGTAWTQQAKLDADDGADLDLFGNSVALSGTTALIGAPWSDTNAGAGAGSAYVFTSNGGEWSQQTKLTASDSQWLGSFGSSVSISGNSALVGAQRVDTAAGSDSGSAYVFLRSEGQWTEQARLTASDARPSDEFGISAALSGDLAIVGSHRSDANGQTDAGGAYVFARQGATWMQEAKLSAADATAYSNFGHAVAIFGQTAVIGAPLDDGPGNLLDSGSAYVFTRSGTVWNLETKLTAPDRVRNDNFGYAVSIDGDSILAGVYWDNAAGGEDAGSARVFVRNNGAWSQQALLEAGSSAIGSYFGASLALSGNTALIGAVYDSTATSVTSGCVYVFTRSGSNWLLESRLSASDAASFDHFGQSLALDGNTALVGADGDDHSLGEDAGSAYIFTRSDTAWNQTAKLVASDGSSDDSFGYSVALEKSTALIGAYRDDTGSDFNAGSAYLFARTGAGWIQEGKLTASDGHAGDDFGRAVAISGSTALIGAHSADVGGILNAGSAFVFVRKGKGWQQQAKLTAGADASNYDAFGASVALAGNTAMVGVPNDDWGPHSNAGSVHVFARSGKIWKNEAKLTASDANADDCFGGALAFEGNLALIGASLSDSAAGPESGSVYAFRKDRKQWKLEKKLTAGDASGSDRFGSALALESGTALVASLLDDTFEPSAGDTRLDHGSVHVFRLAFTNLEIAVTGNGTDIAHGSSSPNTTNDTDFGTTSVTGGFVVRTFTIANHGSVKLPLTGKPRVTISGSNAFTVNRQPASGSVAPLRSQTFQITFDPGNEGVHTAVVTIPNEDPDESPFSFSIRGIGEGESATTGSSPLALPGTNFSRATQDLPQELLAWAMGLDSASPPPQLSFVEGRLEFSYQRASAAVASGLDFRVEWSDTLAADSWEETEVTQEVIADDGTIQRVKATIPAGHGSRFVRLGVGFPP